MSPPTHKLGASKNMGAIFLEKKKRLRQRTHKLGASKNMGAIFLTKKKRLRQRTHKLRAWYQDLGTKIYGEPERRSLSVCRGHGGLQAPPPGGLGGWKPPRKSRGSGGGSPRVKTILWTQNQDFGTRILYFLFRKYEIWSEMGPYGSVGANFFFTCSQRPSPSNSRNRVHTRQKERST